MALLFTAGGACSGATSGERASRDPDLITAEELAASNASTLYEAVERLRPRWLTVRAARTLGGVSGGIFVFRDQTLLGEADVLRQFNADAAYSLRYLDAAEAQGTLPGLRARHVEGAIIIITARGIP